MHLQDSNRWDRQPRLLTDEEIANPMKVVHEVFDYAHLPDLRNTLWDWLKTTVSGNFNKPSLHYKDRESLLAFYEKIQKLLEAAHLLLVANQLQATGQRIAPEPPVQINTITAPALEVVPALDLLPFIEKLVSLLFPELIFQMGKVQELYSVIPIYYFLLVLPNTATITYAACQALVEHTCPEKGTIRLLTVKQNELEHRLKEGHLMYASLCKEGQLIYAKNHQAISSTNWNVLPELFTKASVELDAILYKAEDFYQRALFFLQQQKDALAVFLFQQAIEHCLRGFLFAITGRNHISHDLICLRRHALPFFPQLVHLLPIEKDTSVCLLYQAGKAYVQSRYENNFTMPVTEINRLKQWVEKLLPETKTAFEHWVSKMTC